MSKLAKAIDATLSGNKRASDIPNFRYTDVKFEIAPTSYQYGIDREVRLGVRVQSNAWISEHDWDNPDTRTHSIMALKRAMIEEVFGEFRPMLIELHAAMYDKDLVRARTLVAELENQMFADGL
jgi:hypothetical protein